MEKITFLIHLICFLKNREVNIDMIHVHGVVTLGGTHVRNVMLQL